MQTIENTSCALDKGAEDEEHRIERLEKTLTDYQAQANRPFEHDAQLARAAIPPCSWRTRA